jgi:hypothetical protein
MAETTIEEMKAFVAAYEEMKKAAADSSATDAMKSAMASMAPVAEIFKKKILEGAGAVTALATAAGAVNLSSFSEQLTNITSGIGAFMKNIDLSANKLKTLGVELGLVYAAASGRLALSDELVSLGNVADGTTANMTNMFKRVTAIAPEVADRFKKITPLVQQAFGQVDAIKKMETGLLMNAAAAGNLEAAMGSLDYSMSNLSDMTLEYSRMTAEAGISNNITAGQASNYAQQLMKIPGALADVVDVTGDGTQKMGMLDATIKVAAGTFQPFQEVMKDVTLLFENWNKTGKDSLDFVSKMSSAAQSLKMPMGIMRSYVHDVGEQFKFLGDNTMGAIDIMSRVAPAFEASRLGPRAVAELVGTMTKNMAQMDMAQRAFLSAQTGGPGGLQGAFQIQQQLAEGDTAGVMSKVEDTLKQMFGGPVVTLEEAANDQRAAAQYAKQIQMMTTGPMKVAETEQQAKAMIDAMATGKIFDPAEMGKVMEDPMQKAMDRGNEIQERQFNELVYINNQLEYFGTLAADVTATKIRQGIGSESRRADILEERRARATDLAAGRRFQEEIPEEGRAEAVAGIIPGIQEAGEGFVDAIKGATGALTQKTMGQRPLYEGEEAGQEAELRPLFDDDRRQFGGYAGMGRPEYDERAEVDRELNRQAGRARTISGERVVRRDMAAGREVAEQQSRGERGARGERGERGRRAAGTENTIIIQIADEEKIKRIVKAEITRDGALKISDGA